MIIHLLKIIENDSIFKPLHVSPEGTRWVKAGKSLKGTLDSLLVLDKTQTSDSGIVIDTILKIERLQVSHEKK